MHYIVIAYYCSYYYCTFLIFTQHIPLHIPRRPKCCLMKSPDVIEIKNNISNMVANTDEV